MKFTCQKTELVQALQIVSKAAASKPQMPVLSGIYLKAEQNQLELQATDYEIGIICHIEADVEEAGTIVLSSRYFQEVTRSLPGETVSFLYDAAAQITRITSASANFQLMNMPANEFPTIPQLTGTLSFKIKDNVLKDLIKKTAFACSTDEARPVFTGCLLEVGESAVTMVATNTHRLAFKKENLENLNGSIKIIIPARILSELQRIMVSEIPEEVQIICTYNQISFAFDNLYLTSRLIEGQFPDYHRVIPTDFKTRVTLDTAAFLAAVDRVSLIARAGEYNVIRLEFGAGQVHIFSNNPEIGQAEENVPAVIDGPDVNIAFNAKYVTDVLKTITSDQFYFSLNQTLNPAAIREMDNELFIYIVTPVRTAH